MCIMIMYLIYHVPRRHMIYRYIHDTKYIENSLFLYRKFPQSPLPPMLLWAREGDCMLTFVIRSSIIAHRQNVCLDCVGLTRSAAYMSNRVAVARGALSVLAPAGELKRPPHLPRTRTQQGHCCRRQGAGLQAAALEWPLRRAQNKTASRGAGKAFYHTFYHIPRDLETPHASCGAHSTVTATQTGVRMTIFYA